VDYWHFVGVFKCHVRISYNSLDLLSCALCMVAWVLDFDVIPPLGYR